MAKDKETKQNSATDQQGADTQAPRPRPCPQDCRQCSDGQRLFCTTQMLFTMSRTIQEMNGQIASLEEAVTDIQTRLQPQTSDDGLSLPFSK